MSKQKNKKELKMDDCRYFFRAWILKQEITFSQLDGLKRKYPKAWLNRKSYPFYQHAYAKDLDLEQEYYFNLVYCLVEYAKENEQLRNDLIPFYIKHSKDVNAIFKRNVKTPDSLMKKIQQICLAFAFQQLEVSEVLFNLSIYDVFMEIYSFPLEGELVENFIDFYNEASCNFFKMFGANRLFKIKIFAEPLRTKQGKVFQFLTEYAKRVSTILEEPVISYLKRELSSLSDGKRYISIENQNEVLWDVKNGLNMGTENDLVNTLSYNEVLEIMAMMAFSCSIEPFKDGTMPALSDEQWEKLLTFAKNQLLVYAMEYLIAKTHEKNRQLLFKLSDTTDLVALRQLESDLNDTKKKLRQEKDQRTELERSVKKLKQEQSQIISKEVAKQEKCLIEANQLISKQAQEIDELRLELEKYKLFADVLNSQLSQVHPIDESNDSFLSEEVLILTNQSSVLFVGGHPKLVSRLKGLLPNAKFFEIDKNYDVQFCQSIEQIFILGDYVNHGMVYRVSKYIDAPKRVLFGSNVNQLIQQCADIISNR